MHVVYVALNDPLTLILKLQYINTTSNFQDERKEKNLSVT